MPQDEREHLEQRLRELELWSERFRGLLQELRADFNRLESESVEKLPSRESEVQVAPTSPVSAQPPASPEERSAPARRWADMARPDLEFLLGARGLLLIGVTALVFAVGFFVKEAVERGWIGPSVRVLLGAAVGLVAIVAGERIRAAGYRVYGLWLAAGGFSAVYLSIWASAALYALMPSALAFALMVIVVTVAAALGLIRGAESFVSLAAFGGYLAPLLIQVETDSPLFGLAYLGALTIAGLVAAQRARWVWLATLSVIGGTVMILAGEGGPHLHGTYVVVILGASLAVARSRIWHAVSLLALLLAWASFWTGSESWGLAGVAFAGYAAGLWVVALIACVGVGDWLADRTRQGYLAAKAQSGAPIGSLEADVLIGEVKGLAITLLPPWFLLGSVMAGLSESRYQEQREEIGLALALFLGALYLGLATWGGPGKGAASQLWRRALGYSFWLFGPTMLWGNAAVVRAWVVEGIALSGFGVLRNSVEARTAGLTAFGLGALTYWGALTVRPAADAAFVGAWALTGLAACGGLAAWALALTHSSPLRDWERQLRPVALLAAGAFFLAWGTGELVRFFDLLDEPARWNLARDLSISGFWMLYAVALLTLGFWLERPPIRWAGLAMALIAAGKVFAYDLAALSRLYRIGSFVALALVLLALSFRYQRLRRDQDDRA
ncbi:MAG: DUF2339 domain-containing protein [Gemmatimonadota bacterium]|nr:MAG: DUF2339 domain-containing protein [Gemmatimonadota bacterium]